MAAERPAARGREINPRFRYYVRPGRSYEDAWVVVDRKIEGVVFEFRDRQLARAYVKELNAE